MSRILEKIDNPGDLKVLNSEALKQLAQEIRELMIRVVSQRGGHLASSLGAVELTIALHSVYHTPEDKIIWDVGHQCYAHKILTGRRKDFETLRTYGGLSGFPKRAESPYDAFGSGHSSTSLSAALGMALARDLKGKSFKVVAVIGDGALTGGMALEALNHAGDANTDLLVVLNDNEMSIDHNVGGLPSYLAKLRVDPKYYRLKEDLEQMLGRIPAVGRAVVRSAERFKDGVKYMLVPGVLFEELGFTYLGPIDGHQIAKLKKMLQQANSIKGPVLLHVVTRKGKGYLPAEKEPHRYHGLAPRGAGKAKKEKGVSYSQLFGSFLVQHASQDSSVVAITAAMAGGTGLEKFARRLPERFFDVGIAEQHAVTMAAGLAAEGYRPVVAIYSTFLQRAYDQLLHDVCLQNLPVILAVDRAGLVGEDGETHNGLFDYAYLRPLPHLVLMAPAHGRELSAMFKTAFSWDCPVAIRYPRGRAEEPVAPDSQSPPISMGKGVLLREGEDILILAAGSMVAPALQAHELLLQKGVRSSIINARFIKPLDEELISSWAGRCKKVLTVEEHVLEGGFGSAVLEMLQKQKLAGIVVKCLGFESALVGQGEREFLLDLHNLSAGGIAQEALKLCRAGEKGAMGYVR